RSVPPRPRPAGATAGDAAGPAARPRPSPAVPAGPDRPYDPRRGGCEMTAVHPSPVPPEALTRDLTGADSHRTTTPSGDGKEKGAGRKRKDRGRLSVEWVTLELMRVAYASRGGFLSRRDPRAVIIWYVICAIAPWLTYDL